MTKKEPSVTQSSVRKLRHCNRHVSVTPLPKAVAQQLSDSHLLKKKVLKVTVSREVRGSIRGNDDRSRKGIKSLMIFILILLIVVFLGQDIGIELPEWISIIWSVISDTLLSTSIR